MCVGVLQRAQLNVDHVERRQATVNVSDSQDGPVSPATVCFSYIYFFLRNMLHVHILHGFRTVRRLIERETLR